MDRPRTATHTCERCRRDVDQDDGYVHDHQNGPERFYCAPCSIYVLRQELVAAQLAAANRRAAGTA